MVKLYLREAEIHSPSRTMQVKKKAVKRLQILNH